MSEKPMSSDIMMMMFGRDCAATVARPASPPCATASDNSKPADAVLIIMLFIFVKPPAANVSQEKWCARVLAGRDFALQAFRKTRFIYSAQSAARQTLPARTRAHRRGGITCISARSAFFFFFLSPVSAAPRPIFRLLAELGLDGIVFDVAQRFIKMLPVTNVPIKRIALPESSGPSQRPIALFCRKRSPRACDLAPSPARARREQRMYVIGHYAPGVQVVTFSGEV